MITLKYVSHSETLPYTNCTEKKHPFSQTQLCNILSLHPSDLMAIMICWFLLPRIHKRECKKMHIKQEFGTQLGKWSILRLRQFTENRGDSLVYKDKFMWEIHICFQCHNPRHQAHTHPTLHPSKMGEGRPPPHIHHQLYNNFKFQWHISFLNSSWNTVYTWFRYHTANDLSSQSLQPMLPAHNTISSLL
jgi:hypothetical protein